MSSASRTINHHSKDTSSVGSRRRSQTGLRRRLILAVVAAGVVLAGCGGQDSQDNGVEKIAVNRTESLVSIKVVELAELTLGLPKEELDFSDPVSLEPSVCLLHSAWPNQMLDFEAIHFAELPDGTVVQGPGTGVAQTVLDLCFDKADRTPTAEAVADIVVNLDVAPYQLQLLTPNMASFLEPYGVAYQPPTLVESDGSTVTTFFANDFQVVGVLQVTATQSSEGVLTVDYSELS